MAFCNLKAEMARVKVSQADVAEFLGMSTSNFNLKVNERIPITVQEAEEIKNRFFPGLTLDYLFVSDGDLPTEKEERLANLDGIKDVLDEVGASPEFYRVLADMRREAEDS